MIKAGWHASGDRYDRCDKRARVYPDGTGLWYMAKGMLGYYSVTELGWRGTFFTALAAMDAADFMLGVLPEDTHAPAADKCPLCGEGVVHTGFTGVTCAGQACPNRDPSIMPRQPEPAEYPWG